ncbi:uncharacterized protein LOC131641143 isoform X2 [Vicia villosa]|uniref:uncharacterized protein LOC131641143 isoform X2 n=1 Tax=Vicia villosa TaxID=3911 RepID=UPI00273C1E57|nr:uncharacterized protein LOC131641143 isoform X2 [Vicia villosa]
MDTIQENLLLSSSPNQPHLPIDEELWLMAEERAQEILCTIQPNVVSEVNRKQIIDFVQRLIGGYYGGEVFVFGSVPLKTYLPDGDIDLTVLSQESVEEDLAQAVCNLLGSGEDLEYEVKDIQHIRAQVKVVKCTVKSIAVDISFNQMAGLYALRFLEEVDQLVGKNHVLKRSIILVKAWCYYESRLLGAHHGLLSTYALEILVLYIINCFHSSLCGPLEVLYKFLDYYSTFDWEKNYITIDGPQPLSSLPEIVESDRGGLLLSKELLKNYRDMCSVPKACETSPREFPIKCMNILDPLKSDNNLGRSVNKSTLHRIGYAFAFGAEKLKEILNLPGESIGGALEVFFMNTLNRNGKGQRPDIDVPVPAFGTGRSEEPVLVGDCDSFYGGLQHVQMYRNYAMPLVAPSSSPLIPFDADMLKVQQNWLRYYHRSTIPRQTFFHPNAPPQPTYSLEETGKSRGTGTYIPDMTLTTYWNARAKGSRPRRFGTGSNNNNSNANALPKPLERKEIEEVPSETDMNDNSSKSFEFLNEDFPLLSSIGNSTSSASQQLERKEIEGVPSETYMNENSSKSFDLSNEDFPLLSCIGNRTSSASQQSELYHNSSLPQMLLEFGTHSISQPATGLSLGRKSQKGDSSATIPVVSSLAVETKGKYARIEEKTG